MDATDEQLDLDNYIKRWYPSLEHLSKEQEEILDKTWVVILKAGWEDVLKALSEDRNNI